MISNNTNCPYCNGLSHKLGSNSKFCEYCGTKFANNVDFAPNYVPAIERNITPSTHDEMMRLFSISSECSSQYYELKKLVSLIYPAYINCLEKLQEINWDISQDEFNYPEDHKEEVLDLINKSNTIMNIVEDKVDVEAM